MEVDINSKLIKVSKPNSSEAIVSRPMFKKRKEKVGDRVLINRTSGFGDILMLTAVANELKKKYKHITFRTNYPDLLANNPSLSKVIEAEYNSKITNIKSYDEVIDFNWCVESRGVNPNGRITEEEYLSTPRLEIFFKTAGVEMPKYPELTYIVKNEENRYASQLWKKLEHKYNVTYVLNSLSPVRTYPVDLSIEVIQLLLNNCNVIVVGNNKDIWGTTHPFNTYYYKYIKQFSSRYFLDLTDKTSVQEAIAIIANSNLVICPDTGLLHAANAVSVPCIGLFGNIDPELRCSYYDNVRSIFKSIPCAQNCGDRYQVMSQICPSFSDINNRCIRRIGADCMRAISPREIFDLAAEMLGLYNKSNTGSETGRIRSYVIQFCYGKGVDIGAVGAQFADAIKGDSIIVDIQKGREPSVVADARNLYMFQTDSFDYVYSSHLLEDLEGNDIIKALNEWFRVLKYNGNMIIYCPIQKIYKQHCQVTKQSLNPHHKETQFSLRFLKNKLQECNYKYKIIHQIKLINNYSFLLVLRKIM